MGSVIESLRTLSQPGCEERDVEQRGTVLVHPTAKSTIRGVVGTAFRTPDFLESTDSCIPSSIWGEGLALWERTARAMPSRPDVTRQFERPDDGRAPHCGAEEPKHCSFPEPRER